uniref:Photosystem I reaction center subunit XII n=7 Tax=Laminariaceae TaxID=33636 RepID=A0A8K1SSN9_9PHAE|nr:photosystem I reaction center subunit XII [Saccharina japonica]YP_009691361.1 photosystem I reaction center subunit XII [Laminaria solidungula]YP_009865258.1 photosystem I reaction center subunit XII [Saccharina latissima]YP_010688073.1 photosystem I reaction center subunit XII [Saccharina longissima]YP_010863322.1 photosystem I reaction center subunit XII [Saccharina japonica x Saccharina latissima]YP_011006795.1 Photosystem I reaction center subunit XII [Hedophyllum nigripes]QWK42918.1 p
MLTNTQVLVALTLAIVPALLAFRLGKTLYS